MMRRSTIAKPEFGVGDFLTGIMRVCYSLKMELLRSNDYALQIFLCWLDFTEASFFGLEIVT